MSLVGVTFRLESNTGSDSSSQDLGNNTDKIIFSDYCDVVIGTPDLGDSPPDAGNCLVLAENYSFDYYSYSAMFQPRCTVTCAAYLILVMRGNSRVNLVNQNTTSVFRLMIGNHSLSPYTLLNTSASGTTQQNFDLDVDSQEVLIYSSGPQFRNNLAPGGLRGDTFTLSSIVIGASDSAARFYFQGIPPPRFYTIQDLQTIRQLDASDQPPVNVTYVNSGGDAVISFTQFGGKQADAYWEFVNRQHSSIIEVSQTRTFRMQDPASNAVAGLLKIEYGSYSVTFHSSQSGTPTVTVTEYGNVQEFNNVSNQPVSIISKIFASNYNNNESIRTTADGSVVSQTLTPMRYSFWSWGRDIIYQTAFTLDDETGEDTLIVTLPEDTLVTSDSQDDVPDTASTFDDVYDLLVKDAFEK